MAIDQGHNVHSTIRTDKGLPNVSCKCAEQSEIFKPISDQNKAGVRFLIVAGESLNVTFDPGLNGSGGIKKQKDSLKNLQDICLERDLVDIWRIRNPTKGRLTWRQKSPVIQRGQEP